MGQNKVLDFRKIQESLMDTSYVTVPFPLDSITLEKAVNAFLKFLEEPVTVKQHINFTIAPLHRRGDVGFAHRNPSDHIYNDSKEFFHYHPALLKKYSDFIEEQPAVKDFVLKAKPIWEAVYQTVKDILETFEEYFPGVCTKVFDTEHPHILLRFLRYDWQKSEDFLAKPHFDAGSFTLAVAESSPGLRIGRSPEHLKLVEHEPGNAIFMLSSNFQKVINTDKLSAGWHDVIQMDKTQIGKPFARWAMVAFIDAHGVEALSRTETHKWYNENST
jgi:isopenicillin N synthase-like dioxygenase